MSREKLQKLQKMVRKAQKSLKLASYRIKSQIHDAKSSEYAEVSYEHPKKKTTIAFNRKNIDKDLEDTIVHELLHLFFSKHLGVAENSFKRRKRHRSLKKYQKGEEKTVSILAPLLAKAIFEKEEEASDKPT